MIGDNGIRNLNLEKLYMHYNSKITNLNHTTNLKVLDASGGCGIGDDGIENLKFEKTHLIIQK